MMNSQGKTSRLGMLMLFLLIAEAVLILLSWILSAMRVDGVRSLLSGEGVRWFFGNFTSIVASPWLACLVLLLIALGCLQKCGLIGQPHTSYRDRMALRLTFVFFLLYVGVMLLLTAVPVVDGQSFPVTFFAEHRAYAQFWNHSCVRILRPCLRTFPDAFRYHRRPFVWMSKGCPAVHFLYSRDSTV